MTTRFPAKQHTSRLRNLSRCFMRSMTLHIFSIDPLSMTIFISGAGSEGCHRTRNTAESEWVCTSAVRSCQRGTLLQRKIHRDKRTSCILAAFFGVTRLMGTSCTIDNPFFSRITDMHWWSFFASFIVINFVPYRYTHVKQSNSSQTNKTSKMQGMHACSKQSFWQHGPHQRRL